MKFNARLNRLEVHFIGTEFHAVEEGFTVEKEIDRWSAALAPLGQLLDDQLRIALYRYLADRFQQLVGFVRSEKYCLPHMIRAIRRLPRLLALLLPRTPPTQRPDLVTALGVNTTLGDRRLGRWQSWVWCLTCGDGRLPSDVSEETVGRVLRSLEDTLDGALSLFQVCDRCGLPRPYVAGPEASATACPYCGDVAWTWGNQVGEGRPWQGLAAAELDPDLSLRHRSRRRTRERKAC
jgi:hypothetical protein